MGKSMFTCLGPTHPAVVFDFRKCYFIPDEYGNYFKYIFILTLWDGQIQNHFTNGTSAFKEEFPFGNFKKKVSQTNALKNWWHDSKPTLPSKTNSNTIKIRQQMTKNRQIFNVYFRFNPNQPHTVVKRSKCLRLLRRIDLY